MARRYRTSTSRPGCTTPCARFRRRPRRPTEAPRFVETLPRRGYRLRRPSPSGRRRRRPCTGPGVIGAVALAVVCSGTLVAALVVWAERRPNDHHARAVATLRPALHDLVLSRRPQPILRPASGSLAELRERRPVTRRQEVRMATNGGADGLAIDAVGAGALVGGDSGITPRPTPGPGSRGGWLQRWGSSKGCRLQTSALATARWRRHWRPSSAMTGRSMPPSSRRRGATSWRDASPRPASTTCVVAAGAIETGLPARCCDAVYLRTVFHHASDQTRLPRRSRQSCGRVDASR